jgi:hypothetical protein
VHPQIAHFETQAPGEEVILLLRAHGITNVAWVVATVLLALLGFVAFLSSFWIPAELNLPFDSLDYALFLIIWWLLLSGFALQRYLAWYFNVNMVTNQKIVDVDFLHLFYKQISETSLENVQDITHRTVGFLQNHFDYGDVIIQTAGEMQNFEFHGIPDPDGVQKRILELSRAYKKAHGGGGV